MIDFSEDLAKEDNVKSIQLAIRETQDAAVQLFKNKNYKVWGENPSHTRSYFWGRDPIELTTSTMQWFARGGTHMNYCV